MPRERKYRVKLSDEQVKRLKAVMRNKATTLTVRNRCQILLDMDEAHGKQYLEEQAKVVLDTPVGKNAIGRALKKTNFDLTKTTTGASPQKKMQNL